MLREAWEGHGGDITVVAYVLKLLDCMHSTRELVESNMKAAQTRAKLCYDRTGRRRTFAAGGKVMLLRQQNKQVEREGPAEVVGKLSDTNYAVKLRAGVKRQGFFTVIS